MKTLVFLGVKLLCALSAVTYVRAQSHDVDASDNRDHQEQEESQTSLLLQGNVAISAPRNEGLTKQRATKGAKILPQLKSGTAQLDQVQPFVAGRDDLWSCSLNCRIPGKEHTYMSGDGRTGSQALQKIIDECRSKGGEPHDSFYAGGPTLEHSCRKNY